MEKPDRPADDARLDKPEREMTAREYLNATHESASVGQGSRDLLSAARLKGLVLTLQTYRSPPCEVRDAPSRWCRSITSASPVPRLSP